MGGQVKPPINMTLQELIELCTDEKGKVFIMDEQGSMRLVIMGAENYRALKISGTIPAAGHKHAVPDPEIVNRELERAHLETQETAPVHPQAPKPSPHVEKLRDLREEVIDPSFNFDGGDEI
jgi:hypothetical protein